MQAIVKENPLKQKLEELKGLIQKYRFSGSKKRLKPVVTHIKANSHTKIDVPVSVSDNLEGTEKASMDAIIDAIKKYNVQIEKNRDSLVAQLKTEAKNNAIQKLEDAFKAKASADYFDLLPRGNLCIKQAQWS